MDQAARPRSTATRQKSNPTSPISAEAFERSAANLASSSALLMSVSVCFRPYFVVMAFQVAAQLAQSSGMPTLLTVPSFRARSIRSSTGALRPGPAASDTALAARET